MSREVRLTLLAIAWIIGGWLWIWPTDVQPRQVVGGILIGSGITLGIFGDPRRSQDS